jgi:hypothetical protein
MDEVTEPYYKPGDCACGHSITEHDKEEILRDCTKCSCVNYKGVHDYEGKLTIKYTQEPVCPYCGYREEEWWDYNTLTDNDDEDIFTCGHCENEYNVTIHIDPNFTTSKIEEKKEQ